MRINKADIPKDVAVLGIIKWAVVAALLAALLFTVLRDRPSNTPFGEVASAVSAAFDQTNVKEADAQMIRRVYGINAADYEGVLLYYPATNMGAEELFLAKASDSAQKRELLELVEKRKASQLASFDGYGMEQMDLLNRSLILSQGNYVLFAVSDNTDGIQQAFLDAV